MGNRDEFEGTDMSAALVDAVVASETSEANERVRASRRDFAALFGLLGGAVGASMLTGCATPGGDSTGFGGDAGLGGGPDAGEFGSNAAGLTGTTGYRWATHIGFSKGIAGGATANLRNLVGTQGQFAFAAGFHEAGDGGGGMFYWDPNNGVDTMGLRVNPFINNTQTGRIDINTPGPAQPGWVRVVPNGQLNVKWFGAKGLGDTTDDGPAIRAAIAAATTPAVAPPASPTGSGGTIWFPRGVYSVDGLIDVESPTVGPQKPIFLVGESWAPFEVANFPGVDANRIYGSVIRRRTAPATGPLIRFKGQNWGGGLRDIHVMGGGQTDTGVGVQLVACNMMSLEGVWITSFGQGSTGGGVGLQVGDPANLANGLCQDLTLTRVHLQSNRRGLHLVDLNQGAFQSLMCNQNTFEQALFENVGAIRWCGGLVQGLGTGVNMQPRTFGTCDGISLDGLWFEGAMTTHVRVGQYGATALTVSNCRMTRSGPPTTFFDLRASGNLRLSQNRFYVDPDNDILLQLTDCKDCWVEMGEIDLTLGNRGRLVVLNNSVVTWMTGGAHPLPAGMGLGTALPPHLERFAVGGNARIDGVLSAVTVKGAFPTGTRPTSPTVGTFFFDTTISLPIWWTGSAWVDAAGTVR